MSQIYTTAWELSCLSFAAAMYRSTCAVKRKPAGTLAVEFEQGAEKQVAKNVEIIMDASNSMTGKIGRETKIAAARQVLAQTINSLPEAMNVGFRVYGHRFSTNDYKSLPGYRVC